MKKAALIASLVCIPLLFAGGADLQKFFGNFTRLFAAADHKALIAADLVHFPLRLKGTLDDAPEISISARQFAAFLKKIADQPSGMNAKNFNESEKDYVTLQAKAGKLPADAGNGTKRSGNLVFGQTAGKWQLVQIYVSDDLIAEIGHKPK